MGLICLSTRFFILILFQFFLIYLVYLIHLSNLIYLIYLIHLILIGFLFFSGFLHRSTNYIDLLEKIRSENIIVDAPDFRSLSFENEFYKFYNYIDTLKII
jgi:hypothetical protein